MGRTDVKPLSKVLDQILHVPRYGNFEEGSMVLAHLEKLGKDPGFRSVV